MHGLICSLIRLSKQVSLDSSQLNLMYSHKIFLISKISLQRTDAEKPMHLKLITSDVRQQIIRLDWEAKKEWEKNQVEVEKIQKLVYI